MLASPLGWTRSLLRSSCSHLHKGEPYSLGGRSLNLEWPTPGTPLPPLLRHSSLIVRWFYLPCWGRWKRLLASHWRGVIEILVMRNAESMNQGLTKITPCEWGRYSKGLRTEAAAEVNIVNRKRRNVKIVNLPQAPFQSVDTSVPLAALAHRSCSRQLETGPVF